MDWDKVKPGWEVWGWVPALDCSNGDRKPFRLWGGWCGDETGVLLWEQEQLSGGVGCETVDIEQNV